MRENNAKTGEVIEIDLQKYLFVCLRRWWFILLLAVGFAGAFLLVSAEFITPQYQADVSIYVNNRQSVKADKVDADVNDLSASTRLVSTYISMISSDTVIEKVADNLGGSYTVKDIRDMMTAAQVEDTEIFKVYITCDDPVEAATIANAVAEVAPDEIQEFVGSSTKIIDYAKIPDHRYSPSYSKNTVLGGVCGIVVALIILLARFLLDVRIRGAEDLQSMFEYPVLGQIPVMSDNAKKKHEGGEA